MISVANRFQMIQLGLCFYTSETAGTYIAHPFNIYLFPEDRPGAESDIALDLDGIKFHKDQKLDFNKWIYEGVPYLNNKQEGILRARINEEQPQEDQEVLNLTAEETKRTNTTLNGIKTWWQSGAKEKFVIQNFNPYLRKYMYQKIGKLYPALNIECKSNGKYSKSLILTMLTAESQKCLKDAKIKKQLDVIQRKSGAHKIFKLLSELRPVIVGHGVLYDLMFLYRSFSDELPSTLSEFKEKLHDLFPIIYDTMIILADEQVKKLCPSLKLECVYNTLSKETKMENTKIVLGNAKTYTEHYHEAGYDSYITGSL